MSRLLILVVAVIACGEAHKRWTPPPCGLPKFTEKLTGEKKAALEKIWEGIDENAKECDAQREKTKDLVKTFTDAERKIVFETRPHHGPHFLEGVPDDVRQKFDALFNDHTLTRDDKNQKFHELAQKTLTGKNLEEFKRFEGHMASMKAEWEKKVAALTPEAKVVYDKLQALREEKRKILAATTAEIRKQLDGMFFHGHGHHHRFGGKSHRFGGQFNEAPKV